MKLFGMGSRVAAATLVLCLQFAAPTNADPAWWELKAERYTKTAAGKLRPARGLATYKRMIDRHAEEQGVPAKLARAIVWQESKYKVRAIGSSGERGLMQLMPATARGLGYRGEIEGLHDPETNIKLGMKYLGKAYQLAGGDICHTVLRYNGGLGAKTMTNRASKYCANVKKYLDIDDAVPMNMP